MGADAESGNGIVLAVCAGCGEALHARDRFCEGCGRARPSKPLVPATLVLHEGRGRVAPSGCVDCGAPLVSADGYCEACGFRQPSGRERVEFELAGPAVAAPGPSRAAGVSDIGRRRSRNEDAFAMTSSPGAVCAVVCDGVASAPGSEAAALAAAETGAAVLARRLAVGSDAEEATRAAVRRAADAVGDLAGAPHTAPACTYVSAVAAGDAITVGWVGDSRAYWLREGAARVQRGEALTRDDIWAVRMVARKAMSERDAWADPRAHLLTAWLGADAGTVDPHVVTFAPPGPGVLLVCSDGLWNHFPEPADLAAVLDAGPDPAAAPLAAAQGLVRAALDAGGHDNVTVALIPYPSAEPTREPPR
ncbi:PP2C family protein-serine/threonine phosphatase [Spirillospora sp. NPDC127200]